MNNLANKLILVADTDKSKIFEATGIKIKKLISELDKEFLHQEHIDPRKHQGKFQKLSTGSGHFFDPSSTAKQENLKESAKHISKYLEDLLSLNKQYSELIIVSPPKLLGEIRESLPQKLKKLVTKEISKDLTNHQTSDIEQTIFAN